MTCMCYFFMRHKGISTNSWVGIAVSVLQIKEAQQNGSESAQSYPANNKHAGVDPKSLRVRTHVLSTTAHSLPCTREYSMGKGDGRDLSISGRWNHFYLPPLLLPGNLSTWVNACHISDCFGTLPAWRQTWRLGGLIHDLYPRAC